MPDKVKRWSWTAVLPVNSKTMGRRQRARQRAARGNRSAEGCAVRQIKTPGISAGCLWLRLCFAGFRLSSCGDLGSNRDSDDCERHSDKTAAWRWGMRCEQ